MCWRHGTWQPFSSKGGMTCLQSRMLWGMSCWRSGIWPDGPKETASACNNRMWAQETGPTAKAKLFLGGIRGLPMV
eukprot:4392877-Amphidinium_carterae.1